jgi:hypothetical protein
MNTCSAHLMVKANCVVNALQYRDLMSMARAGNSSAVATLVQLVIAQVLIVLIAIAGMNSAAAPGGHLKLLHLWPGQTPPPRCGGTSGTLVGCGVLGNPIGSFFQPPALAFELEQVAVMHEAVE